ncbi:MAG: DUF2461 domain-containing protein [Ferruginibacter sp.]
MLQPNTLKFLKDLQKNNNRPWFEGHRVHYDTARTDFISMVEQVIKGIATFDKPIGNLETKHCIFRINRDVRFSKNKDPYKNNMAAYFNKDGKKGAGAGYYLHIEPGKSFAAGGIWMPEPAVLAAIRQEIDYNFKEWNNLVTGRSFLKIFSEGVNGDTLTRPPKGYDENNPAIEFLKMKSFIISKAFTDKDVHSKVFIKSVVKTFQAMKPVIDFLNISLE